MPMALDAVRRPGVVVPARCGASALCLCSLPAERRHKDDLCLTDKAAWQSSDIHRAWGAVKREDTMTTHELTLLVSACAALVGALARLVEAIRRPP